jgi:CheY-like chemotaxis protein
MAENRQYRTIVADDDPMMRRLLHVCCERAGSNDVRDFANGKDAWDYVSQLQYLHLLVTDLDMPVMRGDELIRVALKRFPKLPVILVSGGSPDALNSAEDIAKRLEVEFHPKPIVSATALIEKISKYAPKQ